MRRPVSLTLGAFFLCACTGSIGEGVPGAAGASDDATGPAPGVAAASGRPPSAAKPNGSGAPSSKAEPGPSAPEMDACADAPLDPGPSPLNRLSPEQYANSLRDLFGDVPGLAATLDASGPPSEFGLVQPDVAPVELESYQRTAELVAAYVATTPAQLQALAPCADNLNKRDCAKTFVSSFGARVYRAALDGTAVDKHLALYDSGAQISHEHGIELVLRGMLQAPRFLYRVELGAAPIANTRALKLSAAEIAARLSYVLWNTAPDAALAKRASMGALDSADGVRAVVKDMLADARGAHALQSFLSRWMHLEKLDGLVKDERFYPEWTPELRRSLADRASQLLDDVLERRGGTLRALLTTGTDPESGILTSPALLSVLAKPAESSPIYRGKFVREALLCQQLPAPPPNIPKPPEVQAGVSTRERLKQHEVDPACSSCHQLMDPIGFGLENYDAIGRFRTEDEGAPIDGMGELKSTRDANGTFHGARELGDKLAASSEVEECMVRQWFRFARGRFERDVDACAVQQLAAAFEAAGSDLRVLPELLLTSDAFLTRRALDYEETP